MDNQQKQHAILSQSRSLTPAPRDLLKVGSRRWFVQTGLAGVGALSTPDLLKLQAAGEAVSSGEKKSVILFWLSGGPSQLDMWDPKPDAPQEVRSPFGTIQTSVPGVHFTEHLPLQASIAHKLNILRAVDCSASNHTPITMQAGNPLARRTNDGKDGGGYPSMGSLVSKFKGPNEPNIPAFIGLAKSWGSDVYGAGLLGQAHEPVKGLELTDKLGLPEGIQVDRLRDRQQLQEQFDSFRSRVESEKLYDRLDQNTQQAFDMVLSGKVSEAFDLSKETDATRDKYGRVSVGEKALLARRLVEAGSTFVLVSGAWGYFDHHGDDVRWKGIERGLKPLLPRVDRALFALVNDLEQRGLLDSTLVLMMGEFGRTPKINEQAGRHHWTPIMSMVMAGGGLPTGQVVGSSDRNGSEIRTGAVRPQDLAATTFKHLGIDLNTHWMNPAGRPIPIVAEGGRPIPELV
ncbi:MAG TPA: DUF1501 domain-containing protein [Planctomycetaceae bacterium]|jgi:hypothetical protein|nr:DUF1501 domain-containing protein [Planctomycetaceae bacterium]